MADGMHETSAKRRRDGESRRGRISGWRAAADDALQSLLSGGRSRRDRSRQARRLLDLSASHDGSLAGGLGAAVRERLVRSLEAERRRGRARHWTYDFNRHVALLQALADMDEAPASQVEHAQRKTPPGEPDGV